MRRDTDPHFRASALVEFGDNWVGRHPGNDLAPFDERDAGPSRTWDDGHRCSDYGPQESPGIALRMHVDGQFPESACERLAILSGALRRLIRCHGANKLATCIGDERPILGIRFPVG